VAPRSMVLVRGPFGPQKQAWQRTGGKAESPPLGPHRRQWPPPGTSPRPDENSDLPSGRQRLLGRTGEDPLAGNWPRRAPRAATSSWQLAPPRLAGAGRAVIVPHQPGLSALHRARPWIPATALEPAQASGLLLCSLPERRHSRPGSLWGPKPRSG
jgi:hypothetical protein